MTAPIVELSSEAAKTEAQGFFAMIGSHDFLGEVPTPYAERQLALLLQRIYQEGVVAGMDRAIATVKAGHR